MLNHIFKIYTPVVIGYGGNDGSLMGFLESIEKVEGGIFWCYREADGMPVKRINNLVAKHNGRMIPIDGFDDMMLQLNNKLGYELLGEKIVEIAKQKAKRYRNQIENVQQKAGKSEDTKKALVNTIEKERPNWWTVALKARSEEDVDKSDRIYQDGLKSFPDSPELVGIYAIFLAGESQRL